MAHIPHGPVGDPIRNKKELGNILVGLGFIFVVLAIVILLGLLYTKGYKTQKELILIVGIPGAIGLVLIALGNIFRRKKQESIFAARSNRRK